MAVEATRGLVPMLRSALIDLYAKAADAAPDVILARLPGGWLDKQKQLV